MAKEKKAKTGFDYDPKRLEYEVRLRRKRNWWWLLLLLLIIPLFINLKKDITVQVFDAKDRPFEGARVDIDFTEYYFFRHGHFFDLDTVSGIRSDTTDVDGKCVFKDCGYSIYGMIFRCLHRAVIDVTADCLKKSQGKPFYHYLFGTFKVWVERDVAPVTVIVLDREDREPVNEATVYFKYSNNEGAVDDSIKTDAAGRALLRNMDKCGVIDLLRGSCYGYKDDVLQNIKVLDALRDPEKVTLLLEPVKESVTFFVVNCKTRQPIAGAEATITISNAKRTKTVTAKTNTSGQGRAVYADLHILSEISIVARKAGFKDGALGRKYTVEQFIKLSDSLRTICLEPEPCTMEFVNIDSLINVGIEGVENLITVKSGTQSSTQKETSNRNGVFSVKAFEGDEVHIESSLFPDYEPEQTDVIASPGKKEIRMMPRDTMLEFCVYDADDRSPVLQNEDLFFQVCYSNVIGCLDSTLAQDKSANCKILARLFIPYKVSVITKARAYTDNRQIKDLSVKQLINDVPKRQLPMKRICVGNEYTASNDVYSLKEYDLTGYWGKICFDYNTYTEPDSIFVYDAPKSSYKGAKLLFSYKKASKENLFNVLEYSSNIITVEVIGKSKAWDYKIHCPAE